MDGTIFYYPPETRKEWRKNPSRGYWSWLKVSWSFGIFAPWVAWLRYQAMLDDMEDRRRRWFSSYIGAYWLEK